MSQYDVIGLGLGSFIFERHDSSLFKGIAHCQGRPSDTLYLEIVVVSDVYGSVS
jgi:hypothetical protein